MEYSEGLKVPRGVKKQIDAWKVRGKSRIGLAKKLDDNVGPMDGSIEEKMVAFDERALKDVEGEENEFEEAVREELVEMYVLVHEKPRFAECQKFCCENRDEFNVMYHAWAFPDHGYDEEKVSSEKIEVAAFQSRGASIDDEKTNGNGTKSGLCEVHTNLKDGGMEILEDGDADEDVDDEEDFPSQTPITPHLMKDYTVVIHDMAFSPANLMMRVSTLHALEHAEASNDAEASKDAKEATDSHHRKNLNKGDDQHLTNPSQYTPIASFYALAHIPSQNRTILTLHVLPLTEKSSSLLRSSIASSQSLLSLIEAIKKVEQQFGLDTTEEGSGVATHAHPPSSQSSSPHLLPSSQLLRLLNSVK